MTKLDEREFRISVIMLFVSFCLFGVSFVVLDPSMATVEVGIGSWISSIFCWFVLLGLGVAVLTPSLMNFLYVFIESWRNQWNMTIRLKVMFGVMAVFWFLIGSMSIWCYGVDLGPILNGPRMIVLAICSIIASAILFRYLSFVIRKGDEAVSILLPAKHIPSEYGDCPQCGRFLLGRRNTITITKTIRAGQSIQNTVHATEVYCDKCNIVVNDDYYREAQRE